MERIGSIGVARQRAERKGANRQQRSGVDWSGLEGHGGAAGDRKGAGVEGLGKAAGDWTGRERNGMDGPQRTGKDGTGEARRGRND